MNTFPQDIKKPNFPISIEELLPVVKDEFEANYVQVIRQANRARRKFTLNWNNERILNFTDFTLIRDFYTANAGTYFNWIHPYSEETIITTFEGALNYKEELVERQETSILYYSLTVVLEER